MKLTKKQAEIIIRNASGSGSGVEQVATGIFAAQRGLTTFFVQLEDCWPRLPQAKLTIRVGTLDLPPIFFKVDSSDIDYKMTEYEWKKGKRRDE